MVLQEKEVLQTVKVSSKKRMLLLPIMFVFILFAYFDRINVAILATDKTFVNHFGLANNPAAIGFLMTTFLLGYGLASIFLGWVVDKFGPRITATFLCVIWSVVMFAMGFANKFASLVVGRVILGISEGPQFIINSKWVKNWFLPGEQARVNSVWLFGSPLGAALGMPFITLLVFGLGWQMSFWVLGSITLVLVLPLLYFVMVDKPEQAKWMSKAEIQAINESIAAAEAKKFEANKAEKSYTGNKVLVVLKNSNFWLNTIGVMGEVSVLWGLMMWLPSYLKQARGMSLVEMGSYSGITFLALALGLFLSSVFSDRIMRRAPFCLFGMMGMGIAILIASITPSNMLSVTLIWLAAFGFGVAMSPMHVIAQNVQPKELVALGYGMWNGIGNLTSAFIPMIMGLVIKSSGNFASGMYVLVVAALLGCLPYIVLTARRF